MQETAEIEIQENSSSETEAEVSDAVTIDDQNSAEESQADDRESPDDLPLTEDTAQTSDEIDIGEAADLIRPALTAEIEKYGFVQATKLPIILKNSSGINYKDHAPNLDAFLEMLFPGKFLVKKGVPVGKKTLPKIYVPVEDVHLYQGEEQILKPEKPGVLDGKIVEKLGKKLRAAVRKDGYILSSVIPEIMNNNFKINYRDYENTLGAFMERYFPGVFISESNVEINGKTYPKIYVLSGVDGSNDQIETIRESQIPELFDDDTKEKVKDGLLDEIRRTGFVDSSMVPEILKSAAGITNYKEYADNLDVLIETNFPEMFAIRNNILFNQKKYTRIYVLTEDKDKFTETWKARQPVVTGLSLDEDARKKARAGLLEIILTKGFIPVQNVPFILKSNGVENYKQYARSIPEFITAFFSDVFVVRTNIVADHVKYTGIVTLKGKPTPGDELVTGQETLLAQVAELYENHEYEAILSEISALKPQPRDLGPNGIETVLKAIAGFLGEDPDQIHLNVFHRLLIETEKAPDLKPYKDDENILQYGADTAVVPMSIEEFKRVFSNVHNGKQNLNENWNGIIERFWSAQSEYAVYLTALWLIVTKKDTCIDEYIKEAGRLSGIGQIPMILKINQAFGSGSVAARLQIKIISICLERNDIDSLISSCGLFGDTMIPEAGELADYLGGSLQVDSGRIISWFHSELKPQLTEKIANYYWWKESPDSVSIDVLKVLSSVYWEFPENYYTEIIYNPSIPSFGRREKERLLKNGFKEICTAVRNYKKGYTWANYLYLTYRDNENCEEYDAVWSELRMWMRDQVKEQMSDDIRSAKTIALFRLDPEIRKELEESYCENHVAEIVNELSGEDELDDFVENCENQGLQFITLWVLKNRKVSELSFSETNLRSLCLARRFGDALQYIRHSKLDNDSKIEQIRFVLNENFKAHNISDEAFEIFDHDITVDAAEAALSNELGLSDHDRIASLIAIYYYKRQWLKVAYLMAPFKAIYIDKHRKLIEDVRIQMSNLYRIDLIRCWKSHFEVVKSALKICSNDEFDSFIEWTGIIRLTANSRLYSPEIKTFDRQIEKLLSGASKDDCWQQLVRLALRTDNRDRQDNIRFCIIAGFTGRYGIKAIESEIHALAGHPNAGKQYSSYYESLWKGLLNGRYSVNFLRLCKDIIKYAPLTFWNLFYDVAVKKNHVFSSNDFELNTWRNDSQNYQEFYSEMLKQYKETREVIYLKIAIAILTDCGINLEPDFEQYASFISSGSSKAVLLTGIASLIRQNRYPDEINSLLNSEYWVLSRKEQEVFRLLKYCSSDDELTGTEYENLNETDLSQFRKDCLRCIENYPELDFEYAMRISEENNSCRLKLYAELIRIEYFPSVKQVIEKAPQINEDWKEDSAVRDYLRLAALFYQKQSAENNANSDAIYAKNRYIRMFAANLMLEESIEDYSDDNVIALMKENRHFTALYADYEILKQQIYEFAALKTESMLLKAVFLIGLISGDWEQFISCADQYSSEALSCIRSIQANTNYRDLNIQIIRCFIVDCDTDFEEKEIHYVSTCSPAVYNILLKTRQIKTESDADYQDVKSILSGICRLQEPGKAGNSYKAMRTSLEKNMNLLRENWDLYIDALSSTSYKRSIIANLLADIENRKISSDELLLWADVFRSMNENDIFSYLLAVHYALANKLPEAKEAYARISRTDSLPKAWAEDITNLRRYITSESSKFNLAGNKQLRNLEIEKDADAVSFISSSSHKPDIPVDTAVNAYGTIIGKDVQETDRLSAYRQLLSFVHNPEDLFAVYSRFEKKNQREKSSRRSYNELIIEYGSLLITHDTELTADEKLQILLEIFDVYEFLNDINKAKESITERMSLAEQKVLETPGVSFDQWIGNFEKILGVMRNPAAQISRETVNEFSRPLLMCAEIVKSSSSEMELLAKLDGWRKAWNLRQNCSNSEYMFVRSVDEKIKSLKEGVNLSVNIINDEIEDDCVFYEVHNNAETSNTTIVLDNRDIASSAVLEVLVGINRNNLIPYESAMFTNTVELRPGDYCGQYYRLHDNVVSSLRSGDIISVQLNIKVDHKTICNCSKKLLFTDHNEDSLKEKRTSEKQTYGVSAPAFDSNIKGFGRETEKQDIREYLSQQLVVIYGPSRVGKSSLLNYISNDYIKLYSAAENKSILKIGIGDEGRSDDYSRNMLDENLGIPFDDPRALLKYLFITPLKIAFGAGLKMRIKRGRRFRYEGEKFSDKVRGEIDEIVSSDAGTRETLTVISQILEENNAEIWYLIDEFQQIIKMWRGDTKEFTDLCNDIMAHQNNIRVVLCGSDDLVRLYECENDAQWNAFVQKTADNSVQVGQLSPDDFKAMMQDNAIWKQECADAWTPEALELLYSYTGGNAICGKLFGNELLKQIKNNEFEHRRKLYPSDITKVAYELLNSETGLIRNLLVQNNAKNMEAEKPYLLFIAHELMQNRNRSDVSIRRIREFFSAKSSAEVENALKICIARGILKTNEAKQRYGFSTMFYFDFFRSQVTDAKIQELSILMRAADDLDGKTEADPLNLKFIREYFDEADPKVQNEFLAGLAINMKDKDALKGLVGNTQSGTIFNSEATFNQYNIQSITNTLNGIMTTNDPQLLLQGIQGLPRLSNYLPQIEGAGPDAQLSEERISRAMDNYVIDMEESLEASCTETHDTEIDVPYSEILQITDDEWDEFMEEYNLSEYFLRSLKFAYRLEQLFNKGAMGNDNNEIDYSPVTIMYSKLVESLLKEYHIDVYSESFQNEDTELSRPGNKKLKYKWKEISGLTAAQKQKLTIGSFVFPLSKSGAVDKIAEMSGKDRNQWNAHKKMIAAVKDIRNPSAHGNKGDRISFEQEEKISGMILRDGGLLRLIRLAQD